MVVVAPVAVYELLLAFSLLVPDRTVMLLQFAVWPPAAVKSPGYW